MRFLDTLGSESPRIPQQNAPLDTIGRGWNGGNRPYDLVRTKLLNSGSIASSSRSSASQACPA